MTFLKRALPLAAFTLCFAPGVALAHTGLGATHGFSDGFGHPVSGLDHIVAMVGVGFLAARIGGRALWLVPLAFVTMMAMGGLIGMAGVGLPFVEAGIAASVLVLGLAIAARVPLPAVGTALLVGFFALFHGHAHGAEMPANASGLAFGMGFVMATAALHAAGIGLAIGLDWVANSPRIAQAAGGAMALAGIGLLVGAI
jgi:urease accessory protein